MRRYLTNPFASAFSSEPTNPNPEPNDSASVPASSTTNNNNPTTHHTSALPSIPLDNLSSDTTQNQQQQQQPQPSPPPTSHSPKSYVPSLPIAIPSMRKYLFSNSSPTTNNNSPPQEPSNLTLNPTNNNNTNSNTSNDYRHHHLLPHIRRRQSTASSDNIDVEIPNSSTTVDASNSNNTINSSNNNSQSSSPLHELSQLVEKALGPVGNLRPNTKQQIANQQQNDRLLHILNKSVQDRNRILLQFLRARHQNASEALQMILTSIKWRNQMNIDIYLKNTKQHMLLPSACFPMTLISTPQQCKQPVIYGLIRLLDKRKAQRVPFQNALISFLESSYYGESYINDEMIIILDFRDWSIRKNAPYRLVKDGIQTLQDYYPERLSRVFLVNYPTTIRAAYTAISPIIDNGAKEKIVWIADADPSSTLQKYISPKSIPSFLGGELHANFPPSWPDVEAEFQQAKASSSHGGLTSLMSLRHE